MVLSAPLGEKGPPPAERLWAPLWPNLPMSCVSLAVVTVAQRPHQHVLDPGAQGAVARDPTPCVLGSTQVSWLRGFPGILASGRGLKEAVKVRTPSPCSRSPECQSPGSSSVLDAQGYGRRLVTRCGCHRGGSRGPSGSTLLTPAELCPFVCGCGFNSPSLTPALSPPSVISIAVPLSCECPCPLVSCLPLLSLCLPVAAGHGVRQTTFTQSRPRTGPQAAAFTSVSPAVQRDTGGSP